VRLTIAIEKGFNLIFRSHKNGKKSKKIKQQKKREREGNDDRPV
jgi:hypothetical protein